MKKILGITLLLSQLFFMLMCPVYFVLAILMIWYVPNSVILLLSFTITAMIVVFKTDVRIT